MERCPGPGFPGFLLLECHVITGVGFHKLIDLNPTVIPTVILSECSAKKASASPRNGVLNNWQSAVLSEHVSAPRSMRMANALFLPAPEFHPLPPVFHAVRP